MRAAAGSAPHLSGTHQALLAERGITLDTARAAGLRSVSAREAHVVLGFDPKSGGILIPYHNPVTGDVRTYRFRPDVPLVIKDKPAKYLSPRGGANVIYFPPGLNGQIKDNSLPLTITEGEFKALAASQAGFLTIALSGVYGWKTKQDGESQPIPDLDFLNVRGRYITIVFDSDVSLNGHVRRARHALGKELYKRGAATVYAMDLPSADGMKVGLDDFLVRHGQDAYVNLDASELPPTDIPPFLEPISTLLSAPAEPLEFAIEGILPVGASGWIVAKPKTGKSWDMLEEAYSLSTGQPLYGRFNVPKKRRVAIIEEEDPRRRLKYRLERIIHAHSGIVPEDAFFHYSCKKGFRLDDARWRESTEFVVRSLRPEFVYLDVFNRLHAKDINDAQAMSDIILFLDALNREHGCAFRILHHDRKHNQGGDAHDEIMGSRALGGWAEASQFLSRTKEKGVLRVHLEMKDEPEQDFEPEFLIKLTHTEDNKGTCFEYLGPPADKQASNAMREKIQKVLDGADDWLTIKDTAKRATCSKNTAQGHLEGLLDLRLVERDRNDKGAWIYRTAQGAQS